MARLALAAGVAAAALSASGVTAAGASTAKTSASGASVASVSQAQVGPGRCHTSALAARAGRVDAGAGQRYAPVVLTNRSSRTCWVYGYVGLIMIDGRGDVLRTRTRRDGTTPRKVTLRPRASAYTTLHWTEVRSGRETACPASARLIILPPDEVGTHLEIPFRAAPCDDGRLDVSPLAAGRRGPAR
ncbi:DUF4232 domain-containing protein [Sphaerisporangium album]|uniref:DUF4232 domain-containing protein n=1 Tax=Sphaerisporangium album TaxID=509200 RepID=A0A367F2G7_9ACTN|nr:DUF4232 domain-containing protein [Sphaerisporangium album]